MSDYAAVLGLGTELRIYNAGTDSYDVIPWLQSITGPDASFDVVDITTHSSIGGYREKMSGLADGGEVTVTINWHDDEATHQALQDAQDARELTAFQLFWPQYATWNLVDFNAFVTGLTRSSPTDAQITRDLTLTVTGRPESSTE